MRRMTLNEWLHEAGISQAELAKRLEITQGAVSHWLTGRNTMPGELVIKVSKLTGYQVRPHDLRSDLYPNPADAMPLERVTA